MRRRVLIVERDEAGRGMMDRVLSGIGLDCVGAALAEEAAVSLDRGAIHLAIVDELAGTGASLEEVRAVRRRWPSLPVIVTGSVLSSRVLLELMRLGVLEALPKPFSPSELREVVFRVLARSSPAEDESLEYAAAIGAARETLGSGDWENAEVHLRRALRIAPLDAEAVSLLAVREEALGHDARAAQLYRAAWVLGDDESIAPPDPREGLARLASFAGAERVTTPGAHETAKLVDDWSVDLDGEGLVLATIGVVHRVDAAVFFRRSHDHTFAVSLGEGTPETWAYVLDRLGVRHVHASPETRARLDLPRLSSLRRPEAP